MPCLSRDSFLKPLSLKRERHPLPEFGEDAYAVVQALTSKDLLSVQAAFGKAADTSNLDFAFDILSRSLVDDQGVRLFGSAGEAKEGINLSLPALEGLVKAAMDVSGIGTQEEEEKN
jgi:hypothetical protein